jgi:hypothetical protein
MAALPLDLRDSASFFWASEGSEMLEEAAGDAEEAAAPAAAAEGLEEGFEGAGFAASYVLKTWRRLWGPTALFTAALSEGSTLKDSAMQLTATSMESLSSAVRVPSVVEAERKSQMASARRCLEDC